MASLDQTTPVPQLPTFQPVAEPKFVWGAIDSVTFIHSLDAHCCKVTHWVKNSFKVPRSSVSLLCMLICSIGESSTLECIALKAVCGVYVLALQKPSCTSKERDHIHHLKHRLKLWKEGALDEFVCEGCVIQSCIKHKQSTRNENQITHSFIKLMFKGNTRAALQLLVDCDHGGVLNLSDSADPSNPEYLVRDVLRAKYPPAQPLQQECLLPTTDAPVASCVRCLGCLSCCSCSKTCLDRLSSF